MLGQAAGFAEGQLPICSLGLTTTFCWCVLLLRRGICFSSLFLFLFCFVFLIHTDEPSRCYFHDGDGVCEEFEQMTSISDCGVYTPKGFLDQWASNVSVSHHDERCPGWVVIGQPAANQVRALCVFYDVAPKPSFTYLGCHQPSWLARSVSGS